MNHHRELLIARLAELDTQEATQQDLEACYYQSAHAFYGRLSYPTLARIAEAYGEPINVTEEQ